MEALSVLQRHDVDHLYAAGHRVAAGAGLFQALPVALPQAGVVAAQFQQVLPGVDAGVVAVVVVNL